MEKKTYSKPFIRKHVAGHMNKFGHMYRKGFREEIEGVKIPALVDQFGSPVFVISERVIREKCRELYREFSTRYPKFRPAWSYKTNYLDAVCCVFHQEGAYAEVVSAFEYEKARRLGVPGDKIIFNGPLKPDSALRQAFAEGAAVNLDGFDELFKAENIARDLNKTVDVGIRLNMDTGICPQWSRFGFNLENGAAYEAAKRIHVSEWLNLNALHSHIGTFILTPSAYGIQVKKMVAFMKCLVQDFAMTIEHLDFGGGFPSRNRLKGTYLPAEIAVEPLQAYVGAITGALLADLSPHEYPLVYMETGRAMVDEAGYLIATVEGVKRLPNGTRSCIIDAGVNTMPTAAWYNYQVEMDRPVQGPYENVTVCGPLCMNIDIVVENIVLPPLSRGMRLILWPMGAYNLSQWMQFIQYRPAVAMVMENGRVAEIRRAETLLDIVSPESVPAGLESFTIP